MKKFLHLIALIIITLSIKAQVGINNPNPDSSAVLDIKSTTQGLLIPRVTTSERQIMSSFGNVPANSLLVFDLDLKSFCFYDDSLSQWRIIKSWRYEKDTLTNEFYKTKGNIVIGDEDSPPNYLAQLDLAGKYNQGANLKGIKLLIRDYDNDDTHDSTSTYPIYIEDENGKIDFYIQSRVGANNRPTMFFAGEIEANTFTGYGIIPIGGIIMWSGSINSIPDGWKLCNGANGTPNLQNRFIVGAGSSYSPGNTGGASTVTLNTTQIPSHNHSVTDPGHTHKYYNQTTHINNVDQIPGNNSNDYVYKGQAALYNTGSSTTGISVNNKGGGQSHENRPPYYALCFIMRVQ